MTNIFKAKRIDGKGWIYGYFTKYPDGLCVIQKQDDWETQAVDENTLCRCIDCEDKNGNPLFINDMINDFGGGVYETDYDSPEYHPSMAFPPTKCVGDKTRIGIIVEEDGTVRVRTKEMNYSYNISKGSPFNEMELVGNIFDEVEAKPS